MKFQKLKNKKQLGKMEGRFPPPQEPSLYIINGFYQKRIIQSLHWIAIQDTQNLAMPWPGRSEAAPSRSFNG